MSKEQDLLVETARRFFSERANAESRDGMEAGEWPERLWEEAAELGLTSAARSEDLGGPGFDLDDLSSLLFEAGHAGVPLPIAETILAEIALSGAGLAPPGNSFITVASGLPGDHLQLKKDGDGWIASGRLKAVPWGRHAAGVVASVSLGETYATALLPRGEMLGTGRNFADEPRDDLRYDGVRIDTAHVVEGRGLSPERLFALGAWTRVCLMSGAMANVLDLTVGYARDRVQFGRPLAKFQAVQQMLAQCASQSSAAGAVAAGATAAIARGEGELEVAMAKTVAGEAGTLVAAFAHQVHGAMGFSKEYRLQRHTRRLWSWRDEYGSTSEWAARAGGRVAAIEGRDLWPLLTASEHV